MGKTPVPLAIAVSPEWADRPEVRELAEKGHIITTLDGYDLILTPSAHWWTDEMFGAGLLDSALKRARARRPKKPAKEPKA